MKKLGNTVINVLLSFLVLAVVVGAVILGFRFISGGSQGRIKNPFEDKSEISIKTDPDLIKYEEIMQIRIKMEKLFGIGVDTEDRIYVTGDHVILIMDKKGRPVRWIDLREPAKSIAIDKDGLLYLGMMDHVEVYDTKGTQKAVWSSLGHEALITSVAVSRAELYVADAGNRMVMRFDKSGKLIGYIGKKRQQRFIVPSPFFDVAVGRDESLWVANPGRLLLENYTPEGSFISSWGKSSTSIEDFCGCCNPTHFAILDDGSFVTTEKGLVRVKIYTMQGQFEAVVAGPEQFEKGTLGLDVAVDSQGRIIILDPEKGSIRIFGKKDS